MNNTMHVVIFIAGEDDKPSVGYDSVEFSRYYDAFKHKFRDKVQDVCPNDEEGMDEQNTVESIRHLLHSSDSDDFTIIVVDKNEALKRVTKELKDNGRKFTEPICNAVISIVAQLVLSIKSNNKNLEVSLFAHWHVEPLIAERSFNDCIEHIGQDKVCKSCGVAKFVQFAVSSRRKEQFDLNPTNGVIDIPTNLEELRALESRFKDDLKAQVVSGKHKIQLVATNPYNNLKSITEKAGFAFIPAESNDRMSLLCDALISLVASKGINCCIPGKINQLPEKTFPIFVAWDNCDKVGSTVPAEFIIQYKDDMKGDDILSELTSRMSQWLLEDDLKDGVNFDVLREWCCSMFRRYIFLDEEVHADSNVDYSSIAKTGQLSDGDAQKISFRLGQLENDTHYKLLWNGLFADALSTLQEFVDGADDAQKKYYDWVRKLSPNGSEIVYSVPDKSFTALILDDDVEKQKERFDAAGLKKVFGEITCIDENCESCAKGSICLETKRTNIDFVVGHIKQFSRDHRCFDVVLVDLNLGDKAGQDPSGYQLINVLKIFYPSVPIVAYSRYDDMGHISRAFKAGTSWFVRKDDVVKLPRHLLSMYKHKEWEAEWRTITEMLYSGKGFSWYKVESDKEDFNEKFKGERQFLTYKCMEKYPGEVVYIKPMSGGFSSAVTFKAVKGMAKESKNEHKQTPVIIKIDSYYNTMSEYERYFRFIRPYIANESGRVESSEIKLDNDHSAIVYTFTGKAGSSRSLMTMKECLKRDMKNLATCDFRSYEKVLDELFDDILLRIHTITPKEEGDHRFSSYPNPSFGEHDAKVGGANKGFVANYLKRIALARCINDAKFIAHEDDGSLVEFHMFTKDGDAEAYDYNDGMTILLKGDSIKHASRFRKEILPGRALRIAGDPEMDDGNNLQIVQDPEILKFVADDLLCIEGVYSDGNEYGKNICKVLQQLRKMSECKEASAKSDVLRDVIRDYGGSIKSMFIDTINDLMPSQCHVSFGFDCLVERIYAQFERYIDERKDALENWLPVGIIHGDLNYANIMLDDDGNQAGRDVWLIDFARTRRDVVAHDFNVIFTSTIALLFDNDLWTSSKPVPGAENYRTKVKKIFAYLINDVIFDELSDVEPDYIADDKRFVLIYKILRRIRRAAIGHGMNTESYAVTTALCCLYTFRIMLKYEHSIPAAAAMLAIASMIYNKLDEGVCHGTA